MGRAGYDEMLAQNDKYREEQTKLDRDRKMQRFERKLAQSEFVAALVQRIKHLETQLLNKTPGADGVDLKRRNRLLAPVDQSQVILIQ